jgi:hypothetical protein
VQQRLSAWLLLWLEALAASPLAAAGTALKQDLPVLLSALLRDQQAGGRAAAGMRNVPALGGAGGLQVEQWLPLLAAAAAQADEVDAAEGQEGSQLQQQDSDDKAADAGEGCTCWSVCRGPHACTGSCMQSRSWVSIPRRCVCPLNSHNMLHADQRCYISSCRLHCAERAHTARYPVCTQQHHC